MICKNCNSEISDDSEICEVCGVYVSQLKVDSNSMIFNSGTGEFAKTIKADILKSGIFLNLENGTKFDLSSYEKDTEISIGRKDVGSNPVIDIGPYDKGPYISRRQGFFTIENNNLFFTDTSKNGTYLNDKIMEKEIKTKLVNGDIIQFGQIKGVVSIL